MRLVLDTNVVASGSLWDGRPVQLIDAAQTGEVVSAERNRSAEKRLGGKDQQRILMATEFLR